MRQVGILITMLTSAAFAACAGDTTDGPPVPVPAVACDSEPVVMTTSDGVPFVRTPDACFDALPDWAYTPRYVEIDGLRQAYVDEGPADGPIVLLLHGQPSWSYLYRKMIPVLVSAGYRVIAMDHLGMGRSDKPTEITAYTYLGHNDRLLRFIEALDLRDINLFVQDWGSLIGLRVAGLHPDRFARIAVGNGTLPDIPAGTQPYPPVDNPDEVADIPSAFDGIPAQQVPFYDGCELSVPSNPSGFAGWMTYAMTARSFHASEVLEAMTWFDLSDAEEAAYDAPFPSRTYMAGPRVFPSLVNEVPGTTQQARAGLAAFTKPFVTIWAANDPGNLGQCATQQQLARLVPGSWAQPHVRLPQASHFLQDDQGPEIARRLVDFYRSEPVEPPLPLGRDDRYCEILLVRMAGSAVEAEVWGTQNLNDCPQASWDALDPNVLQSQTGALAVVMNGPRNWLVDSTTGTLASHERMTFESLQTRLLAVVEVDPTQTSTGAYFESTVRRTTAFTFHLGAEIYELTSPDDVVYVMQSYSQIVDPDLAIDDLPGLGRRLSLPPGWLYQARTLNADLVLETDGRATVLQDDLKNTYQRVTTTGTSTTGQTLPILPDGTGTPCDNDTQCEALDANVCLTTQAGGYCTVEGCGAGACGAPYVCCFDCLEAAAPFLPFEGSACIPGPLTTQLSGQAGCTCE